MRTLMLVVLLTALVAGRAEAAAAPPTSKHAALLPGKLLGPLAAPHDAVSKLVGPVGCPTQQSPAPTCPL